MCGIVFSLSRGSPQRSISPLIQAASHRGQHHHQLHSTTLADLYLHFFSSVLHLRGPKLYSQPVVDPAGDVLCYNGQVFQGLELDPQKDSDTAVLWNSLRDHVDRDGSSGISQLLGSIEGPYAIVYYHAKTQMLYFARDPLGRRSLLLSKPSEGHAQFVLGSVGEAGDNTQWGWEEVGCESIWQVRLEALNLDRPLVIHPISRSTSLCPINSTLPDPSYSIPLSNPTVFPEDDTVLNKAADQLLSDLTDSVRRRVENVPPLETDPQGGNQARLAILFSGGLDCTVLAFLADQFIPPDEPIDLLNVAFENPRSIANQLKLSPPVGGVTEEGEEERRERVYGVPDRITGREACAELRTLRPDRIWNFVEVNIPYESLALALYFASRGQGTIFDRTNGTQRQYDSPARVLLSGLGADEQLGGYGRHRRAYELGSWKGLIDEIQLDIDRLPSRNLGRDDRIISSHSKEARFPYLSLSFIRALSSVPIERKCDFRYAEPRKDSDEAIGDKVLLRLLASRLGLLGARGRKKRAMQFGSRSAKMEVEPVNKHTRRKGMGAEKVKVK